jgi:hypothetical protein
MTALERSWADSEARWRKQEAGFIHFLLTAPRLQPPPAEQYFTSPTTTEQPR